MLAIPRIDALPEATKSATRPRTADKAASGAPSFVSVLAGLVGHRASAAVPGDAKPVGQASAAASKKPVTSVANQANNLDNQPSAKNAGAVASTATAAAGKKTNASVEGADSAQQNIQKDRNGAERGGNRSGARSGARSGEAGDVLSAAALSATALSARANAPGEQSALRGAAAPAQKTDGGGKAIETIGSGTETRPNGTKVSVVDLRLKAAKKQSEPDRGDGQGGKKPASGDTVTEAAPDHGMINAGDRIGSGFAPGSAPSTDQAPKAQAATHGSFAESLAARLRDGAADIVRSAQVVLRNGDVGLIRMRLEPETLGGVKIELKMAEKQISGRIIVESDVAGEAFRSSLDALKDAFAESGFDVRSLEVEVRNSMASGTGGDGRDADRGASETGDGPYWSRSLRELDAAVPMVSRSGRDGLLNVLV